MRTIPWRCPKCLQPHALVRLNRKKGSDLGVLCNQNPEKPPKFVALEKSVQDNINPADVDGIPTYYTHQAKLKVSDAGNLQFVLMNFKEGEKVERSVDLTRGDDQKKADELQGKIKTNLNKQEGRQAIINKAHNAIQKLKAEETELRRELRVAYTMPLKLE